MAALPDSPTMSAPPGSPQLQQPLISPFSAAAEADKGTSAQQQQQHVLLRTAYGGFSTPEGSVDGHSGGQPPPQSRTSFVAGNPLWMDGSGSIPAILANSQPEDVPAKAGFKVPPPAARKMPLVAVKQNSVLPLDGDVPLRTVSTCALLSGLLKRFQIVCLVLTYQYFTCAEAGEVDL